MLPVGYEGADRSFSNGSHWRRQAWSLAWANGIDDGT